MFPEVKIDLRQLLQYYLLTEPWAEDETGERLTQMAPLVNREILDAFRTALSEWQSSGFVVWMRRPAEWLRENLDEDDVRSVSRLMFEHLEMGGQIDQVVERREIWRDHYAYHYDFRITIGGRKTYIETVLNVTSTGPTVTIVSMHDE